jgi:hypothetical protein
LEADSDQRSSLGSQLDWNRIRVWLLHGPNRNSYLPQHHTTFFTHFGKNNSKYLTLQKTRQNLHTEHPKLMRNFPKVNVKNANANHLHGHCNFEACSKFLLQTTFQYWK